MICNGMTSQQKIAYAIAKRRMGSVAADQLFDPPEGTTAANRIAFAAARQGYLDDATVVLEIVDQGAIYRG